MKYENVPCPVCGEKFTSTDNVVVCPKCGTPHHRECYEKLGHCVNLDKHSEGYVWVSPIKEEVPVKPRVETKKDDLKDKKIIQLPKDMDPAETEEILKMAGYRKLDSNEKIGDITVEEYGTYVDKNKHKYIPKFYRMNKTGSKLSWNWAAFLFPVPWLFYRKMIGLGIIVALFISIVPAVFAKDFVDYTEEMLTTYESMSEDAKVGDVRAVMPQPPLAYTVTSYISFGALLFCGMFGNYFYMKKANKDIKEIKSNVSNQSECADIIRRKGSTSMGIMILAVFLMYSLLELVFYKATSSGADLSVYVDKLITKFQK